MLILIREEKDTRRETGGYKCKLRVAKFNSTDFSLGFTWLLGLVTYLGTSQSPGLTSVI